jgi:hypothetical protein
VYEVTDCTKPFEAFNVLFVSFTSLIATVASSGSLNTTVFPPSSNLMFLKDVGVGEEASGYSLGSRSLVARGDLITRGGNVVVVVVVVVTTVVRVAGAKENWPIVLLVAR